VSHFYSECQIEGATLDNEFSDEDIATTVRAAKGSAVVDWSIHLET